MLRINYDRTLKVLYNTPCFQGYQELKLILEEDLFIAYRTFDSIALRSNGVANRVAIDLDKNKKRGDC